MTTEAFLLRLDQVRPSSRGFMARCPGHDVNSPYLSIHETDDRVLAHCFAGCQPEAICRALGLELRDLFFDQDPDPVALRRHRARRAVERTEAERQKRKGHAFANASREAERLIASASGIDIAGWGAQELEAAVDLIADAYDLLEGEYVEGR